MTACRLGSASAPRFAIVGQDHPTTTHAVTHVGLLVEADELTCGKRVGVYDMGPPMHAGRSVHGPPANICGVDVVAWLDGTERERREAEMGIAKWLSWIAPQSLSVWDYVAVPAHVEVNDRGEPVEDIEPTPAQREHRSGAEPEERAQGAADKPPAWSDDGERPFLRKCSCAGFVERAYRRGANIQLVQTKKLPLLSKEQLETIWDQVRIMSHRTLARLGLGGSGPWPVLLPGYLVHALGGDRTKLPAEPSAEHACFPG